MLCCCSPDYIASCVNEAAQRRDALRGQQPRTWLVSWQQQQQQQQQSAAQFSISSVTCQAVAVLVLCCCNGTLCSGAAA